MGEDISLRFVTTKHGNLVPLTPHVIPVYDNVRSSTYHPDRAKSEAIEGLRVEYDCHERPVVDRAKEHIVLPTTISGKIPRLKLKALEAKPQNGDK